MEMLFLGHVRNIALAISFLTQLDSFMNEPEMEEPYCIWSTCPSALQRRLQKN